MHVALAIGTRVEIKPHATKQPDGTLKPRYATVTGDPVPTPVIRVDGTPVGFYVPVGDELFHAESLAPTPTETP